MAQLPTSVEALMMTYTLFGLVVQLFTNDELDRVIRHDPRLSTIANDLISPRESRNRYGLMLVDLVISHGLVEDLLRCVAAERPAVSLSKFRQLAPYTAPDQPRWGPEERLLAQLPTSPAAPRHVISGALVERCCELFPDSARSLLALGDAALLLDGASLPAVVPPLNELPVFDHVGPKVWWTRALEEARLLGPRSLGALLLVGSRKSASGEAFRAAMLGLFEGLDG